MRDLRYARDSDVDSLRGVHCRRGHRQGHRVEGKSAKIASDMTLLLLVWSSEGDFFLKCDDTKLVLGSNFSCGWRRKNDWIHS